MTLNCGRRELNPTVSLDRMGVAPIFQGAVGYRGNNGLGRSPNTLRSCERSQG